MRIVEIKLTEKQSDLLQEIIYDFDHYSDAVNPMKDADKSIAKENGRYIYNDNWYHNGWGKWDLCYTSIGPIIDKLESNKTELLNHWNIKYRGRDLNICNNLIKKLEIAREVGVE
tara:strand:+ start:93 stop:437 length:345 start_codon:yes stop_codon:yes gene_type:complete